MTDTHQWRRAADQEHGAFVTEIFTGEGHEPLRVRIEMAEKPLSDWTWLVTCPGLQIIKQDMGSLSPQEAQDDAIVVIEHALLRREYETGQALSAIHKSRKDS